MRAGNTGYCVGWSGTTRKEKCYTEGNGNQKPEERTGRSCNKKMRKRGKEKKRSVC